MNQELSVWALIENNEFERACAKADREYQDTGDVTDLRNKVFALFHLKKYDDVIPLCARLIEFRKGETQSDFLNFGIAHWFLGNKNEAIQAWERAQLSIYKDAAGGIETQVFLYFAAIKDGQEQLKAKATKSIKKIMKSKRSSNWPGPIGNYLLDEITETELFAYVVDIPILKERQLSQACFVSAIKSLEAKEVSAYYQKLRMSVSYAPYAYLEQMYYLAKVELELTR